MISPRFHSRVPVEARSVCCTVLLLKNVWASLEQSTEMLSNLSSIKENQIRWVKLLKNSSHILLLISRCCVNVDFGLLLIDHLLSVVFGHFCCARINISLIQVKAGRNKTAVPGSLSACGVEEFVQNFVLQFNAAFLFFASSQSPGAHQSDIHTLKTTSTGIFRENNTHKLFLQQCFSL